MLQLRHFFYFILLGSSPFLPISPGASAQDLPSATSVLERQLVPIHPRLFIKDSELPAIKQKIDTDPFVKALYQDLLSRSESLLLVPPHKYALWGADSTLLPVARDVEDRIFTLAGIYRITGDKRFAERAIQEMQAAAAFPNWNPGHFLDTAELTAALGVGYDWLYPLLSPEDRTAIRSAMITKGILPWLEHVRANHVHFRNNWSQVCNGGETVGVLAIAEQDQPENLSLAKEVVDSARSNMAETMQLFAPDGGFEEGPVYWNYATIYNVLYLAALDSAIGTDFNEADEQGFSHTAEYRIQSIGPIALYANFGDAHPAAFPAQQMFWFSRRFNRPEYAIQERQLELAIRGNTPRAAVRESIRFSIFGLFWAALAPSPVSDTGLPRVQSFSRIAQAYMRSAWNTPQAWFIGFKGGDAHANHGHLDLGSFVLDGLGERWAVDLASDSYGLPGYFGKERWTYYRTRTEGHNTLTIDGQNEDLDAVAPLLMTKDTGPRLFSIANLDAAYKNKLQRWRRGVAILDGQRVLIQDEVIPSHAIDIVWNLHTDAEVEIAPDKRTATLRKGASTIQVRLLSPSNCTFALASTEVPPPQSSNPDISNLVIRQSQISTSETIAVVFSALKDEVQVPLRPMASWAQR